MTPDLDVLSALLAAATAAKGDGRWRDENTKVNAQMDYLTVVHDPDIIISLIEAARREAGLRDLLDRAKPHLFAVERKGWCWCADDRPDRDPGDHEADCRWVADVERVGALRTEIESLLPTSAGAAARAALPAEGTE